MVTKLVTKDYKIYCFRLIVILKCGILANKLPDR